jgi:hypothetical protein
VYEGRERWAQALGAKEEKGMYRRKVAYYIPRTPGALVFHKP